MAGERTYAPDPALEKLVTIATARWSRSTGLNLKVGEKGIPIILQEDVFKMKTRTQRAVDEEGNFIRLCGDALHEIPKDKSGIRVIAIHISSKPPAGCPDLIVVLLHELGHSLRPEGEHTARGLMSEYDKIMGNVDDVAVAWVCEDSPCTTFKPEWYMPEAVQ